MALYKFACKTVIQFPSGFSGLIQLSVGKYVWCSIIMNNVVMSYECNLNVIASSRGDHYQTFEESTYFFPYLIRPESPTSCRPRAKAALSA